MSEPTTPEPIAEMRTEYGHRLDPTVPDWHEFHPDDRAEVWPCRREGGCTRPLVGAYPAVHVWRRVIVTEWQEGTPNA